MNQEDASRPAYKVRAGYPRPDCASEWKRHKRNLWIYLAMLPGWILYGFLMMKVRILTRAGGLFFFGALIVYVVLLFLFGFALVFFRCPRCGSFFYLGIGWTKRSPSCPNCGLLWGQCED